MSTTAPLHPLTGEALLSFARAARELPSRTGGHAHSATLWRWATTGARTPASGRVRLERVRIGSTWYTSREALARFLAALSAEPDRTAPPPIRTPGQRQRAAVRAGRELEKAGI